MIRREDIQKLAGLARLKLSPEEEEKFASEIDSIVGYVAEIGKFAGTTRPSGARGERVSNALRADEGPHAAGIHTDALLAEAPKREDNYVKVKKILS